MFNSLKKSLCSFYFSVIKEDFFNKNTYEILTPEQAKSQSHL